MPSTAAKVLVLPCMTSPGSCYGPKSLFLAANSASNPGGSSRCGADEQTPQHELSIRASCSCQSWEGVTFTGWLRSKISPATHQPAPRSARALGELCHQALQISNSPFTILRAPSYLPLGSEPHEWSVLCVEDTDSDKKQ